MGPPGSAWHAAVPPAGRVPAPPAGMVEARHGLVPLPYLPTFRAALPLLHQHVAAVAWLLKVGVTTHLNCQLATAAAGHPRDKHQVGGAARPA